ncbi:MAG TPA: hypothetical protein VNX21_00770 [Candidatus Thermoplasmatota archaeon]|nr:hypothetical protein [Candidatus Thermoplasmatota archaeon]
MAGARSTLFSSQPTTLAWHLLFVVWLAGWAGLMLGVVALDSPEKQVAWGFVAGLLGGWLLPGRRGEPA